MYKLFLDTHDEKVSVAFIKNNEVFLKEINSESHSTVLLPLINEMLSKNNIILKDIDEIIVVNGPGSFTGIRIGLTVAKTLAYSLNIPIKTISSLKAYLVSSDNYQDSISVIEDSKGYYVGTINSEVYVDSLNEYNNYKKVENKLDILKIIDYVKNEPFINVHSIKANYVKIIEVLK